MAHAKRVDGATRLACCFRPTSNHGGGKLARTRFIAYSKKKKPASLQMFHLASEVEWH